MKKSLFLGILSSLFFAFTFILNKQMNNSGGLWSWSASLRYIFMLPILFVILFPQGKYKKVLTDIVERPKQWFLWSFIGFGVFYALLCYASNFGESWLIAGTWQITIIAGALLSPLFYKQVKTQEGIIKKRQEIPKKFLVFSSLILIGIFVMQFENAQNISFLKAFFGVILVIIAAFAYPLGNRKMMEVCGNRFSTIQRVFGMTLCSMPLWITFSLANLFTNKFPSSSQILQSFIVAIFSGVIATILFFKATDLVKNDTHKLAVIESTQSGEVLFSVLGGVLLFGDNPPSLMGYLGIFFIIVGMTLNSFQRK